MQRASTTGQPGLATLDGGRVRLASSMLEALDSQLAGPILGSGDEGWEEAIHVWNGLVERTPALVVQPETAQDVAAAVGFAREHGALLGIKGGGHNIAGTAIADGGLTLDMARMHAVAVDPEAKLAHVGPGCRLRDVDRATQEHGLATTLGFVSKTGVAGLTLGGGFGYLARRFGWAVDNLEEAEVVTADGEIRRASATENPDLYFAIRGGGGNFGVVTRFTFRLHEVGPEVTGGLIVWGADRADEMLGAYRDLVESAPRELTVAAVALTAPPAPFVPAEWHGKRAIGLLVCHTGEQPDADLAALRELGEPIVDLIGRRRYVEQQSLTDDMEPDGLCQYWKTEYLPELSAGYLETFREHAFMAASPLSYSVIFHVGGALNERAADDGAVGNRDAAFISGFSAVWEPGDPDRPAHVAWARDSWQAIRPFSTGGNYVNFQLGEDGEDRTAAAYGPNYERLRRIKAAYDPGNLFRVNRNIPPAV